VAVINDPRGKVAFQAGRPNKHTTAWRGCSALVLGLALAPVIAAEDPYLQALENEVEKVEHAVVAPDAPAAASTDANLVSDAARTQFEGTLRERYTGTYEFYRKLPERSRQEIFDHYQHGASIADVRKKIIDRLLQQ
jgi:hypothetical protein